ncbi:AAA family ATPase [Chloroflexota bacterium]
MADQVFVAREREVAQLWQFLDRTLGDHGQICFVTGEVGSGKTALVTEFARRAQERNGDLVVAVGQCDAHTGIGDPYLPFREVLCQLTGDVDAKLTRGAITEENASRLRRLVVVSSQVLVEVAPDLISLFVPGANIVGELGKAVAKKAGWMDKLEELAKEPKPGGPGLDQSQVFEQYTKVLIALAEKQPLLLILDDLHWADEGSTALLFRLGRRIEGSHILILGTYRPEEVALDRAGERHPMQKVLAEFKRYFWGICVDLDRAREAEGSQFVDAVLAAEPNRLGKEFRQVLFQRTRGHPLFTIELLRDMQERGVLVQDEQGYWLEGPLLDWNDLPDRVEGIIEERIGRLEEALRDILSVASVEGQDFTAQVVARVEGIQERELLRLLSQDLDKRHRLVREREEVKLGKQYLARYQFAHALFQQYLYNQLGAGERRMLHGEIAALLEELYQGQTAGIAVQLARHYTEAGDDEKAADHLLQAGDAAARLFAHVEARLHYARALEALARLPDTAANRRRRADILIKQVASSWLADSPEQNLVRLKEARRLVEELPGPDGVPGSDQVRLAHIHCWLGRIHGARNALPEALEHYSQVLPVAQEIGDPELLGFPSNAMGQGLMVQGRVEKSEPLFRQSMTALEQTGHLGYWVQALANHGAAIAIMGDYAEGLAELQRALARAQEMGSASSICLVHFNLGMVHLLGGDPLRAIEAARKAAEAAEKSGDRLFVYWGRGVQAYAEADAGQLEAAEASMARSQAVAQELGGRLLFEDWFLAVRAEMALGTGRIQEALALAERAVVIAQEMDSLAGEAIALLVWGQALASLESPRWDEAESRFAESLRLIESMPSPPQAARTHLVWGTVCRDRGNPAAACEHWERAAALWEACGITWQVETVRVLIETLPEV